MPRRDGKPTIAERLAAAQDRIDEKRADQAARYERAKTDAGVPARGSSSDLRGWVKANRASRVAEFAGLHLFPGRIVRAPGVLDPAGAQEDRPVEGVSAEVGTSGAVSARATLTRSLVPGLHGWQKKSDDREAWLTVDGPDFQWVVPVPPSRAGEARRFAAAVTSAGRSAG